MPLLNADKIKFSGKPDLACHLIDISRRRESACPLLIERIRVPEVDASTVFGTCEAVCLPGPGIRDRFLPSVVDSLSRIRAATIAWPQRRGN